MKLMMTGGGTLGPVTPLLAVVEAYRLMDPAIEVVWVGTKHGPEREVVEKNAIPFFGLTAPKLDRHAPLRWVFIPFKLAWSLKRSFDLVRQLHPDVVVTAGGYVSLPLVWIAWFLGIPVWVHQQDVRVGLANLLMASSATRISCAWLSTLKKFPANKTIHLGNPVRESVLHGVKNGISRPTLLVLGGGTGATWINQTIFSLVSELVCFCDVVHLTGKGKQVRGEQPEGYRQMELVTEGMAELFAEADVVVCRAGMGTISELSALRKAAIIIPIPHSHQEENTRVLAELDAAVIVDQSSTTPQVFLELVRHLLADQEERQKLGARLHTALPTDGVAMKLAQAIKTIAKTDHS